jgi:DNA processing protein
VVESHTSGGALHTVAEAERRSRTVLAVPGSVLNPAAAGTNRLLFDGAGVARDAIDVLGALGLEGVLATSRAWSVSSTNTGVAASSEDPLAAEVLRQAAAGPVALDALLPGRPLARVVTAVQQLVAAGLVEVRGGVVAVSRP